MNLADSCPSCITRERSVTCEPVAVSINGGQALASYRCGCGNTWSCSWNLGALESRGEAGAA